MCRWSKNKRRTKRTFYTRSCSVEPYFISLIAKNYTTNFPMGIELTLRATAVFQSRLRVVFGVFKWWRFRMGKQRYSSRKRMEASARPFQSLVAGFTRIVGYCSWYNYSIIYRMKLVGRSTAPIVHAAFSFRAFAFMFAFAVVDRDIQQTTHAFLRFAIRSNKSVAETMRYVNDNHLFPIHIHVSATIV